jgi:hypothetical protein
VPHPVTDVAANEDETLKALASKYIWWQDAEAALRRPQRVIAQIMNIGDHGDVLTLIS